ALDTGKSPKWMTLTPDASPTTEPRTGPDDEPASKPKAMECVYKFDGRALVLAVPKAPDKRPTDFKFTPATGGDPAGPVAVIKLKKLDEPKPTGGGSSGGGSAGDPDVTRAQGTWRISKIDVSFSGKDPRAQIDELMGSVELTVKGTLLTANMRG